ncbi:hypothetical protein JHK84_027296 [Glycine max]|nr:hypothetical protein JHK84_027296 [Glycine max]
MIHAGAISHAHVGSASVLVGDIDDALDSEKRYLKRGVNDRGRVANDVETEQIVLDEESGSCKGKMSSVVQMRGSIPLFWSQEASRFSPKPDIILQRYDPTYQATKLHFEDLAKRYGNPIIVLNLIKTVEKRPREMMLRREFANDVGYLNQILPVENHLRFIHWDFHKFAKSKSANVLVLGAIASEALDLTGFYYSGKPSIIKRANKSNQTSTGRDTSLRDLRASSVDLVRIGNSNEMINSVVNQDKETDMNLNIAPSLSKKRMLCSQVKRMFLDWLKKVLMESLGREVAWTVAALSKKPRGVRGEELAALGFNCSIIRTRFSERKCTHTG